MQDLSNFDLDDVAAVLDIFGRAVPEEYKPLWPAVGVFLAEVETLVRRRRHLEAESARTKDREEKEASIRRENEELHANPEELERVIAAAADKVSFLGRKKIIDTTPQMVTCPHCSKELPVAQNIRFWSPEELQDYAEILKQVRAIADRNRAMEKLPLGDVVEGVA